MTRPSSRPWQDRSTSSASFAILGLNLLKLFFDETVNFTGYLAQVPELPESGHSRLFRCLGSATSFLHRFRDEFAKRDSAFGAHRFGAAKDVSPTA
jgi:hypothetical protein